MSPVRLGEFEQLLLLAILRLGDDAYGLRIGEEVRGVGRRRVSAGALYTSLDRLEEKGMVRSRSAEAPPARGGRPRRYFSVTASGARLLRESPAAVRRLSNGLDEVLDADQ